jgi:trehalose-6-phosphate synthase
MYVQPLVCIAVAKYSRLVNSIFGCDIIRFTSQSIVYTYLFMCSSLCLSGLLNFIQKDKENTTLPDVPLAGGRH